MRRAPLLALLLTAGSLVGPAVARAQTPPTTAPETGVSVALTEAPTNLRDDPRALVYVIDHLHPGDTITRKLRVENGTSRPQRPSLYVAPAKIQGGGFVVGDRGAPGRIASWSTLEPATLQLAPGAAATAELRIAVPRDAQPGESYGAALVEVSEAGQGAVKVASRVGIRIYLSVGSGSTPRSDFEVTGLQASRAADGSPVVTATVHNIGERAIDMSGQLRLSDGPGGVSAGPFNAQLGTTLGVGQTEGVRVPLDEGLPAGPWKARLTMRSGRIAHTVGARITFPEAGETAETVNVERLDPATRPVGALAAVLVLLVALALLAIWLRSRRREEDDTA